jgi:hypothetical protein
MYSDGTNCRTTGSIRLRINVALVSYTRILPRNDCVRMCSPSSFTPMNETMRNDVILFTIDTAIDFCNDVSVSSTLAVPAARQMPNTTRPDAITNKHPAKSNR